MKRGGNEKSGRSEGGGNGMSSKDLASVNQLRAAVRQLQKDGQEQLTLEYESQATFEYFHGQINALQKGYKTLSDVLLEEVDTLRTEFGKRLRSVDSQHQQQQKLTMDMQREVTLLKKTFDVWSLKERDWAKDNEILKVSQYVSSEKGELLTPNLLARELELTETLCVRARRFAPTRARGTVRTTQSGCSRCRGI